MLSAAILVVIELFVLRDRAGNKIGGEFVSTVLAVEHPSGDMLPGGLDCRCIQRKHRARVPGARKPSIPTLLRAHRPLHPAAESSGKRSLRDLLGRIISPRGLLPWLESSLDSDWRVAVRSTEDCGHLRRFASGRRFYRCTGRERDPEPG